MASSRRQSQRVVLFAAAAALLLSGGTAVAAPPSAEPSFSGGEAQPVFNAAEAVREDVWVRAPIDSDRDGKDDEVHVQVVRPAGAKGKLPVVYQASPYFSGGNDVANHNVDVELYVPPGARDPRSALPPGLPPGPMRGRATEELATAGITLREGRITWQYEDYFLSRGFAVMYGESLGTGKSTGCPTSGGRNETVGSKAPIDWLNGRAQARDAQGKPVAARWATGKVGMMGVSYNGTLPIAVASTGVQGLEAIVPIGAISNWYDYYRANGAVVAPGTYQGEDTDVLAKYVYTRADRNICKPIIDELERKQDRVTGDYGPFWDERNYLNEVGKVRAAVLSVHGLNDFNVKTLQATQWYQAVTKANVPHKIWLHQSGHTDPIGLRKQEWLRTVNRWFSRYLLGQNNGIDLEPRSTVQREDKSWVDEADWPAPGTMTATTIFQPGGRQTGGLVPGGPMGVGAVSESLDDDATKLASQLVAAQSSPNRLAYLSKAAKTPLRVSGTVEVNLGVAFKRQAANVTALLVDRAPDGSSRIVTRGWTDPQNRDAIDKTTPIKPGEEYRINVKMQPHDYVLAKGHRLGIVILSSDNEYTLRPKPGPGFTVNLGTTRVALPIVGGQPALNAAIG
ncbi:Xaa-Pro dipeptidyl-peptidase [Nocardia sp. CDC159]|uniref:Xaa-Pro dipeptidyl-peptidase n=1 Tax=Nocardia pulmonis TaxID=2951408 RepID=A0A9X2ECS2_9NOCA|nr:MULTISPECIES: Xaa-Pro dipeptidyl-peptidase [Nocardia]MCM6778367.1 Xaa-Pro dipeptidyl-peptidase [Nocardia pulmonis]MCM6791237.1 Xaa-Pro dipeptidyl-peptidase [Nocardia sp. CDC159]